MQFVPAVTPALRAYARERPAGTHLPYIGHVDDHTVLLRDGSLLQTVELGGLLFETADTDDLNFRKRLRDSMLQALGSSRYAVYHHVVRQRVEPMLDGEFPDDFSRALDQRWRERLSQRQLYANQIFLSLIRRPAETGMSAALHPRNLFGGRDAAAAQQLRARGALTAARDGLVAALGAYRPRVLGVYDSPHGPCSELLEFLSLLYHGRAQPVRLPLGDAGLHLPNRRIAFGQGLVELADSDGVGRSFAGVASVKDYPGATAAGMLDEILRLPAEMVVTQSFAFVDRRATLGRMNLALRRLRAADDEALSLRGELADAKDEVAAGRAHFGEHHMTVLLRGESPRAVDDGIAEIHAIASDLGMAAVREEIGLEAAHWAQFPGNFKYIARRALISTANFAGFASSHAFAAGRARNNHWGDAVTLLETTAAGPYHFNFHAEDLGNFTIIGPSGSGKTVVLNFLLAQAQRFAPRTVFFDKDRGAELFLRAIGGRYDVLRPGEPTGLNPLRLEDSPAHRQFLVDWLRQLAGGADVAELADIRDAVDANFGQPVAHRRLRHLAALFRGAARARPDDLYARLRPWWGEGERAWLFDNAEDRVDLASPTLGFDMTQILDDPALRTPAMMYLFLRVEERLDGAPTIIVVDEGWKALDDEVFVRRVKDWEKTIRKRNGIVGFATQSAQDALESRIASAIVEQAATQIFLPNNKAQASDYIEGFGLTAHEFALVRSMPGEARCFLVKHGGESVVVRLNLSADPDLLTILSGRERTVRLLDQIRRDHGEDPAAWIPRLLAMAR